VWRVEGHEVTCESPHLTVAANHGNHDRRRGHRKVVPPPRALPACPVTGEKLAWDEHLDRATDEEVGHVPQQFKDRRAGPPDQALAAGNHYSRGFERDGIVHSGHDQSLSRAGGRCSKRGINAGRGRSRTRAHERRREPPARTELRDASRWANMTT
jgi:hypothetical protein